MFLTLSSCAQFFRSGTRHQSWTHGVRTLRPNVEVVESADDIVDSEVEEEKEAEDEDGMQQPSLAHRSV